MRTLHVVNSLLALFVLGQTIVVTVQAQNTQGLTLSPIRYSGDRIELRINGPPSRVYRVDGSTNLENWSVVLAGVTGGSLTVSDGVGRFPYRFYRAFANPEAHLPNQSVLALQGLKGNTLVAGKTTAFRFFTDPLTYTAAHRIEVAIVRPDGLRAVTSWSRPQAVAIPNSSLGSSLVLRVLGRDLPWVGNYYIEARMFDAQGGLLASYSIDQARFLPTKDLRVIVDRLWSGTATKPGEIEAAHEAMARMAWLFPVRDGTNTLSGDQVSGLRYLVNNNPSGPPDQDGHVCPVFSSWRNRPVPSDNMDLGILYRFPNSGEGCGANGPHQCSGLGVNHSVIVWEAPLAHGFCHETAHGFGLVDPAAPHFDPTGQASHSKLEFIDNAERDLGFDIQRNQALPARMCDLMYPVGDCPGEAPEVLAFHPWDWEYLRQRIVQLPSTGPTAPTQFTTDVAPAVAGVGNSVYFFAKRSDGRIFSNRAVLGQAGVGWTEMEGEGRTGAPPAAGAVGDHVFVAVKGLNGNIFLNQADFGQPFGQWISLGFTTDVAPAVTGVGNSVFVFAKGLNRRIYVNQAELGQGFSGWFEVQGDGLTDAAPAAGAVGNHVFVTIKGLEGTVFLNQADLGQAFNSFWTSLDFTTDRAQAVTGVGNNVYLFATNPDGRIFYNRAQLGQGFVGWSEVPGGGRTDAAPGAGAVGTHVFAAVKGLDGRFFLNQADLGQSFGQWFP